MKYTSTLTTLSHSPYDGCDDCDRTLMAVAEADYRAGLGGPIAQVFKRVRKP